MVALADSCTKLESGGDRFAAGAGGASGGGAGQQGGSSSGGAQSGSGGAPRGGSTSSGGRVAAATSGGQPQAVAGAAGAAGNAGEAGSGGDGDPCVDTSGFQGLGCYRCEPRDIASFENACTDSVCTRFENALRLTKLSANGALPELPAPDSGSGGSASAGSGGATSGGATSGGATSNGGATSGGAAGVTCESLQSQGALIYVTGSSAARAYLQQVAQQLAAQNVYLVYASAGSCVGVDAILNGTTMSGSATYWDGPASAGKACSLPAGGASADIGVSDVFAQTCPGFELASIDSLSIRDAHGPIQTMAFAVPANSKQFEISAQAAYFAFGFGKDGGVLDAQLAEPVWNDEALLFQRSSSSGTQAMLGAAIGLAPARFRGKSHKSSDELAASLQSATSTAQDANGALGIIAVDYLRANPLLQIRALAFQDSEQACAVYPDSSATARDKRNVRDGHYPLWGPLHLFYRVDSSGNPINPDTRQRVLDIIGYLAGSKTLPNGVSLLDVYAQNGLVPECAMRVTRSKDGGNLAPLRPASPCGCSFEAKATGNTRCTPCNVQGDCQPSETCSLGYCEP
ncbi:MAG: hypothetical protein QM756_39310 [Polyangiaceae bacterium]